MTNDEVIKLQALVDKFLGDGRAVRVLEAGCGSSSRLDLGPNAHVVGIDASQSQLRRNQLVDEKIAGDIQTYQLPASSFDVVVSWDVFQHLSQPERAMLNFISALKDGGLIILKTTNVLSIKGMVAKFTPHWFHLWFYRNVYRFKEAGTDGLAPYRTFMRLSIAPMEMIRFALEKGLAIEYFSMYEVELQQGVRERFGIVGGKWTLVKLLTKVLSLGKVDAELSEYILVLRKRGSAPPASAS